MTNYTRVAFPSMKTGDHLEILVGEIPGMIRLKLEDEGVVVDVYGSSGEAPIASTWALYDEINEDLEE